MEKQERKSGTHGKRMSVRIPQFCRSGEMPSDHTKIMLLRTGQKQTKSRSGAKLPLASGLCLLRPEIIALLVALVENINEIMLLVHICLGLYLWEHILEGPLNPPDKSSQWREGEIQSGKINFR